MLVLFKKLFNILELSEKKKTRFFLFLTLVNVIVELVVVTSVIPITQILLRREAELPIFGKINFLNNFNYNTTLYISLTLLMLLFFFKNFLSLYFNFWQQNFSGEINKRLSKKLFCSYILQPYKFHLENNSALLGYNVLNEVPNLSVIVKQYLIIIAEIFVLLSMSIMLILYEPIASIFLICFAITIMFFSNLLLKKYSQLFGYERHFFLSLSNKNIFQAINNIKDIKILNREKNFIEKFSKNFSLATKFRVHLDTLASFPRSISELILILSFVLLVIFFEWKSSGSNLIVTTISLFLIASYRIIPSIIRLTNSYQIIQSHSKAAEKILIDLNLSSSEISFDLNQKKSSYNLKFEKIISLQDLSFAYSRNKENVFSKINLDIKKNQMIGIVGESGCGKTTLIDIIIGLHKPVEGYITIDGVRLTEINQKLWQSKIGYVSQDTGFVDDTIVSNIAFGIEDEFVDKKKLLMSIKKANLENLVNTLTLGLDTVIGESGVKISGGQKQRIAIARALYQNPEVLVFDEATSALDVENENSIFENIRDLKNDKTIIIVTHKHSLLNNCDQIFELKKGLLQKKL
jgi:ABC-type multidrug transport system fused ATPase/permease subunit